MTQQDPTITRVPYGDYELATYSYGSGDEVVLLVNGGPGLGCEYLREPHIPLAEEGYRVIAYDQLGCGASSKPDDLSLWTLERYVEELEHVRRALALPQVHLYGHSWGVVLGIEYALTYPENFKSLILSHGTSNVPFHLSQINELRAALGSETLAMMRYHEAMGTLEHPEYQAVTTLLNYRHLCRMDVWPQCCENWLEELNADIYVHMQGPSEYYFTGNLKNWSREEDLHRIEQPVLVLSGQHDCITPANARQMHAALPHSDIHVFKGSAHLSFFEEPDQYWLVLTNFLAKVSNKQATGVM